MTNPYQEGRDGKGRYTPTLAGAQTRADALTLRSRGMTYQQIADHLGISKGSAHEAVQKGLAEIVAEPAAAVRELELVRLDTLYQAATGVLEREHVTVSNGRVVTLEGEPLPDDGPVLQAVDRLLRISERRAKLLGLDAPSRVPRDAEQLGAEIGQLLTALTQEPDHADDSAPQS